MYPKTGTYRTANKALSQFVNGIGVESALPEALRFVQAQGAGRGFLPIERPAPFGPGLV